MIDSTPVGRITSTLEAAGYRRILSGLRVGNLDFEFPAAFVPDKSSSELVLVADSTSEPEESLSRKVDGVARALDVTRSTRSLTLVVAGPRPSDAALESMSRVCRVLPTGSISGTDGETVLKNWLAVLLPLTIPLTQTAAVDALASVRSAAHALDDATRNLIETSLHGKSAVAKALHASIDEAVRISMEPRA